MSQIRVHKAAVHTGLQSAYYPFPPGILKVGRGHPCHGSQGHTLEVHQPGIVQPPTWGDTCKQCWDLWPAQKTPQNPTPSLSFRTLPLSLDPTVSTCKTSSTYLKYPHFPHNSHLAKAIANKSLKRSCPLLPSNCCFLLEHKRHTDKEMQYLATFSVGEKEKHL